jgi:hypothetical protein
MNNLEVDLTQFVFFHGGTPDKAASVIGRRTVPLSRRAQKLWQLGEIERNPASLIAGAIWLVPSHKNRIKAALPNNRKVGYPRKSTGGTNNQQLGRLAQDSAGCKEGRSIQTIIGRNLYARADTVC